MPQQRVALTFCVRGAGFELEAIYFANDYFGLRHAGAGAESVLCRAILNEAKWRDGGMNAETLEYITRKDIAAIPKHIKVSPSASSYAQCHNQLLRSLVAAKAEDRLILWRDQIVAWLGTLEPSKNPLHSPYDYLIVELGRMGRADLGQSIPYGASGDYLEHKARSLTPDLEPALQAPMLIEVVLLFRTGLRLS